MPAPSPFVPGLGGRRIGARHELRQTYRPGRPVPGWLARVLNWL